MSGPPTARQNDPPPKVPYANIGEPSGVRNSVPAGSPALWQDRPQPARRPPRPAALALSPRQWE